MPPFRINFPDRRFDRWPELYALVHSAFAYMDRRIDPPSSLLRMTVDDFQLKARTEQLLTVHADKELVGCAFVRVDPDKAYIGKVAVAPHWQGQGLGKQIFRSIEDFAAREGIDLLELQTRVELVENHLAFASLGFQKSGETNHHGYDRPTSVTMQKRVEMTAKRLGRSRKIIQYPS